MTAFAFNDSGFLVFLGKAWFYLGTFVRVLDVAQEGFVRKRKGTGLHERDPVPSSRFLSSGRVGAVTLPLEKEGKAQTRALVEAGDLAGRFAAMPAARVDALIPPL